MARDRDREERDFLHDLATPLATALLLVGSLTEDLQEKKSADSASSLEQLHNVNSALTKMFDLLKSRRAHIIANNQPTGEKK